MGLHMCLYGRHALACQSCALLFPLVFLPQLFSVQIPLHSLLKEVTSYEKEANDALQVIERVRGTEGKDEYDIRQAVSRRLSLEYDEISCLSVECQSV